MGIYDNLLDRWMDGADLTANQESAINAYIDAERIRHTFVCLTVEEVLEGHTTKYIVEHGHFGAGSDMTLSELPAYVLLTAQMLEDDDRPGWHSTIHIRDCECIDDGADD